MIRGFVEDVNSYRKKLGQTDFEEFQGFKNGFLTKKTQVFEVLKVLLPLQYFHCLSVLENCSQDILR
jgi:hypothetical protein